jgi:hypothetical protein
LKDWGDISLLSSLLYNMRHTHTLAKLNPKAREWERDASHNNLIGLFITKTKD